MLRGERGHGIAVEDYLDIGEKAYEQRFQLRRLTALTETAKSLGYTLVPNVANG